MVGDSKDWRISSQSLTHRNGPQSSSNLLFVTCVETWSARSRYAKYALFRGCRDWVRHSACPSWSIWMCLGRNSRRLPHFPSPSGSTLLERDVVTAYCAVIAKADIASTKLDGQGRVQERFSGHVCRVTESVWLFKTLKLRYLAQCFARGGRKPSPPTSTTLHCTSNPQLSTAQANRVVLSFYKHYPPSRCATLWSLRLAFPQWTFLMIRCALQSTTSCLHSRRSRRSCGRPWRIALPIYDVVLCCLPTHPMRFSVRLLPRGFFGASSWVSAKNMVRPRADLSFYAYAEGGLDGGTTCRALRRAGGLLQHFGQRYCMIRISIMTLRMLHGRQPRSRNPHVRTAITRRQRLRWTWVLLAVCLVKAWKGARLPCHYFQRQRRHSLSTTISSVTVHLQRAMNTWTIVAQWPLGSPWTDITDKVDSWTRRQIGSEKDRSDVTFVRELYNIFEKLDHVSCSLLEILPSLTEMRAVRERDSNWFTYRHLMM